MMGREESLEFFLNLSRKELQGLCKAHNLTANRSHVQLAKSLASFFKKKNAITTFSKERSSNAGGASFNTSSLLESKPKETVHPPEQTTRDVVGAFERRTNSSDSDSYRLDSNTKQTVGDDLPHSQSDDLPHSQTRSQLEIDNSTDSQNLKKSYVAAEEVVCPYPNSGATEGFGCSTSEMGGVGIRPSTAAVQEIARCPRFGHECHDSITLNETQKPLLPEIPGLEVLAHAARNIGPSSFASVPCTQQRIVECSIESGLVSSDETSTKVEPSFQFFVMSEEGIHIYVDLNSNPSEWINSLKDEVSICQKAENHNSSTISNHIRGLADVNEHMNILSSRTGTDLQGDRVERNTGCTNSSLSSVVSESCHSEVYAPDRTAVTSRSSVLTSSSSPVEISGCFKSGCFKGNHLISSSSIIHTNVQNQMAFDVASCPRDGKVSPQNSVLASIRMEKSNTSVVDVSPKSIVNIDASSPDETKNPDLVDRHSLKIAIIESNNVETSVIGNAPISTSEKQGLLMPDLNQNKMESSDMGGREKDGSACQVSVEKVLMDGLSAVPGQQNSSLNSSKLDGCLVLDCPSTDSQSDAGSANNLLNQHACGSLGNSVTEDPLSALNDELDGGIAAKERCFEFQKSVDRNSKRSHSSELPDNFSSKRQHSNNENKSGTMMNLRSSRTLVKETLCDPVVLPRRSTRLVSK